MSEPERPTPAASTARGWDDIARQAGSSRAPEEQQDDLRQLLTFEVAASPYAIPVERVREIVRIRPISPVPRVPADVCGVISLRGEIVEVIDLRRRLNLDPTEPGRSTRIIVAHGDDGRVAGILVDAVREVSRIPEEAIRPAASAEAGAVESLCVRGEEFISLIDLDRVLQIDADH